MAPQGIVCAFLGSKSKLDLNIDYRPLLAKARSDAVSSMFNLSPADSLLHFAAAFNHSNTITIDVKGAAVTEYCAWLMDAMSSRFRGLPKFATPAGDIHQCTV